METLFRKYRPIDFDTVVGQDAIVKTLKNQIISGNISHAYLFSGIRGTGKTTVARIFARAINCPHEIAGNPCNECEVCKAAIAGADYNILELDAASNGNVDSVRQITDSMQYPPINDEKYKVYIIDEAHALSGYSKEAFLKSLEEPPEYVIYILATTDPNKLPETILSRCQKYNFRRITIADITAYLKKICDAENINIDDDALTFIAEKGDGSLRDSISNLDRCRAYSKDKLTKEAVIDILGLIDDDEYANITKAINTGDVETAFNIIGNALDKGKDIYELTKGLIWHLRNILIVKSITKPIETLNITNTSFNKLKEESTLISKDVLIYFIEELSRTLNVMRYDENRRVILETSLIRLANPETNLLEPAIMARIKKLEEALNSGSFVRMTSDSKETIVTNKEDKEKKNLVSVIKVDKLAYDEIGLIKDNWKTIGASQEKTARYILLGAEVIPSENKEAGVVQVLLSDTNYGILEGMHALDLVEESLKEATKTLLKKDVTYILVNKKTTNYSDNITIKLDDAFNKIVGIEIETEND